MLTSFRKYAYILLMLVLLCLLCAACVPAVVPVDVTLAPSGNVTEAYIAPAMLPAATPSPTTQPQTETLAAYGRETPSASASEEAAPAETSGESLTLVPVEIGGSTLYRMDDTDYLTLYPAVHSRDILTAMTAGADKWLGIVKKHPDVKYYAYYITRSIDCDWYREKEDIAVYDYASFYQNLIADAGVAFDKFEIRDFADYKDTGYKTDFHINHKGTDRVYGDIYDMLSADMQLSPRKEPVKELDFDDLRIVGDLIFYENDRDAAIAYMNAMQPEQMDVFRTYKYDLGDYTSYVDDVKMVLGLEEEYEAGQINRAPNADHQFSYYGGQTGIVRFEFDQPDKPNLLMCSDSQGRPSRKLIASHFNTTIFLDTNQWRTEDIDAILEEYDIGVMLMTGQRSIFEVYGG